MAIWSISVSFVVRAYAFANLNRSADCGRLPSESSDLVHEYGAVDAEFSVPGNFDYLRFRR